MELSRGKIIKLTDIDWQVFIGTVIEVTDVKDESPNYGFGEDSITGEVEGREIMVPQSEIRDIEILGHDNPAYR